MPRWQEKIILDIGVRPSSMNSQNVTCQAKTTMRSLTMPFLEAQDKLTITLLKMIRNFLMNEQPRRGLKWRSGIIQSTERVQVHENSKTCFGCHFDFCGNNVFQDRNFEHDLFFAEIQRKTCACRRWKLESILCVHAMCVIMTSNMDPFEFSDDCYKKESYK